MKFLPALLLVAAMAQPMFAQDADPLAVTLSNGKVIHFPTAEQKARYEAARQRQLVVAPTPTPAPVPVESAKTTPHATIGSALDAPSNAGTGRGNIAAPVFTAAYYQADPESWVGKSVTLSVGYLTPGPENELVDGQRQMTAQTYNYDHTNNGNYLSGGTITVFAKPDDAFKLINQCGTALQWLGGYWSIKTTMLKGKFGKTNFRESSSRGTEHYCVFLSKD